MFLLPKFAAPMTTPGFEITSIRHHLTSEPLEREVLIDCYVPPGGVTAETVLLLINDGQDLLTMNFAGILDKLYETGIISNLLCVGIHCGRDRKNEYGTSRSMDYKGRGARSPFYTSFVMNELIPFLRSEYSEEGFREKAFAGFSLGGLSALDIAWEHPGEFTKVGVFSGSLWWRDKDHEDEDFNEDTDRIMHRLIREGEHYPWMKFFFEVGTLDETSDRNKNGIIDSIDDTSSLIKELLKKGYSTSDIFYLELPDGRHDVATWARAWPVFLEWAFGKTKDLPVS